MSFEYTIDELVKRHTEPKITRMSWSNTWFFAPKFKDNAGVWYGLAPDGNMLSVSGDESGWDYWNEPKKLVKYYRPKIVRNSNGEILTSGISIFHKTKEVWTYLNVVAWDEIEIEE